MKPQETLQDRCQGKCAGHSTLRLFKRILVAVDGSEQAEYATDVAARLARQLHADVLLVKVFSSANFSAPEIGFIEPDVRSACIEASKELLARAKVKMPAHTNVETVVREGDTATEILNAAKAYHPDLIVMGTHARGRVAQVVLGSVAQEVTQKAPCPVLTVAHQPLAEAAS